MQTLPPPCIARICLREIQDLEAGLLSLASGRLFFRFLKEPQSSIKSKSSSVDSIKKEIVLLQHSVYII